MQTDKSKQSGGALSHLRVLDLSRVLAGPWAGQTLADLGADVIKVERPGVGDDTRHWGPPWLADEHGQPTTESAYYLCANRGKRSVTIDITQPEGQELVRQLAAKCDVVIENFKVGGLAKYGLDYASIKAVKPDIIYCSITGFGQTGPYAHRPGYDFMIQGMGGLMSITGEADDQPGGGPQKVGVALADVMTGLYATIGILAAVAHRNETGEGQQIDLALLDVQTATLANQAMNYLVSGKPPERLGNAHPNIVPYQAFATSDGHLILAVGNDGQFRRLCDLLGESDWGSDSRFATNAKRVENRAELVPLLIAKFQQCTTAEWMGALEEVKVPCGPINTIDQVFCDPQVLHRNMRVDLSHAQAGTVALVGNPIKLSRTESDPRSAPPMLGEQTEGVLSDLLGLGESALQALRVRGVV